MRITDAGDITLHKAGVFFTTSLLGSAGLYLNTLSSGPIAFFQANKHVYFYGTTLEAGNIKATGGPDVTAGVNSLVIHAINTTITGPTVITGGGLNSAALNAVSIVTPSVSPPVGRILTLNGTNTNSKIVMGTGTVAIIGNAAITGT